jgi:drug/metabolite transporter (DMT)-like permease
MPYLLFLIICFVWGTNFILMKKAMICFSPVGIGAWRVLGGAAILAFFYWRRGRGASSRSMTLSRREIPAVAFVVAFGFLWPFSIQPFLVARDGSAFIAMMVSLTPLVTLLASIPLMGLYPTRRQVIGVTGALGFMGLLMFDGLRRMIPPIDLVCAASVPVCYALVNIVIRRRLRHVPSLELSLVCLTAAGALLLPFSLLFPSFGSSVGESSPGTEAWMMAIMSLAFLGIVGTGMATYFFNKLVMEQGPLFAGMVTNLVPLGAVAWAWMDREPVTAPQLAALAGIVAMVTIVQYGAAGSRGAG